MFTNTSRQKRDELSPGCKDEEWRYSNSVFMVELFTGDLITRRAQISSKSIASFLSDVENPSSFESRWDNSSANFARGCLLNALPGFDKI